jgi:hypothetical protein
MTNNMCSTEAARRNITYLLPAETPQIPPFLLKANFNGTKRMSYVQLFSTGTGNKVQTPKATACTRSQANPRGRCCWALLLPAIQTNTPDQKRTKLHTQHAVRMRRAVCVGHQHKKFHMSRIQTASKNMTYMQLAAAAALLVPSAAQGSCCCCCQPAL